jgi:hypothetical protein
MIVMFMASIVMAIQTQAGESTGERPYEMVWAGRIQDDHLPLIDFEDITGWRVELKDAEATFERSREQQIWGKYVGKLTYRGTGSSPQIRILPPEPVRIGGPFDAVTCWIYGNNWAWAPDPNTPQIAVSAMFQDNEGDEFHVYMTRVRWREWFLTHRRLTPEQIRSVAEGARFAGFLIEGGSNKDDRVIYFDNLAVFVEEFPSLKFDTRPKRGIPMFPGQTTGTNTGPGQLPFPTRPETILPDNLMDDFETRLI